MRVCGGGGGGVLTGFPLGYVIFVCFMATSYWKYIGGSLVAVPKRVSKARRLVSGGCEALWGARFFSKDVAPCHALCMLATYLK